MKVRGRDRDVQSETYSEHVLAAVERGFREVVAAWEQDAVPVPPEDEVVGAMLDALLLTPVRSELGDAVGPFYDTAGVMRLLGGVTKQAVYERRKKLTVLALKTAEGNWVYPVFQFAGRDVNRALVPAVQAFRHSPPWSVALWFVTPNDDLDKLSPLDWVKADRPVEGVALSARRTAAEWV